MILYLGAGNGQNYTRVTLRKIVIQKTIQASQYFNDQHP